MREFPITSRQQGALFWVIRNLVDESDERVSNAGLTPQDRADEMADVDSLIDLMEVIGRTPGEIADLRSRYLDDATRAEIEAELAEAERRRKNGVPSFEEAGAAMARYDLSSETWDALPAAAQRALVNAE